MQPPPEGAYTIVQEVGKIAITVKAFNYNEFKKEEVEIYGGGETTLDIKLEYNSKSSISRKEVSEFRELGDIDNNGEVTLQDAVIALQIMAGIPFDQNIVINICADINNDCKIGLEEVVYILQKISDNCTTMADTLRLVHPTLLDNSTVSLPYLITISTR